MVTINLLPWRLYERQYQLREIKKIVCIAIGLAFLLVVSLHMTLHFKEKHLVTCINLLKHNIKEVRHSVPSHQTITLEKYRVKTSVKRNKLGTLLFLLSQLNENPVCFKSIERKNHIIKFSGIASSAMDLTTYLNPWNASPHFSEIKMKNITQQKQGEVQFEFDGFEHQ